VGAFLDEIAFEFGAGAEHVEDEAAAGGGGVDRFLERTEAAAASGECSDAVDEVGE
jgi:hypothetical protein